MNPIFNTIENNFIEETPLDCEPIFEKKIDVFCSQRGRKSDTYIAGLEKSDEDMKVLLKTLKKKCACNGSVKMIDYDSINTKVII